MGAGPCTSSAQRVKQPRLSHPPPTSPPSTLPRRSFFTGKSKSSPRPPSFPMAGCAWATTLSQYWCRCGLVWPPPLPAKFKAAFLSGVVRRMPGCGHLHFRPWFRSGPDLAPPAHAALHLHRGCSLWGRAPVHKLGCWVHHAAPTLVCSHGSHRGLDRRTRAQPSRQSLLPQSLSCLAFWMSTEPSLWVDVPSPLASGHTHTAPGRPHTTCHTHTGHSHACTRSFHLRHSHLHTHSSHPFTLAHTLTLRFSHTFTH